MVKIERSGNDLKMNFSDPGHRFSVKAKDLDEVGAALHHYYGKHANGSRFDTCPICRKYTPKERHA